MSFAKKNNLDYIQCSAFNALNIDLVFEAIVKKVVREKIKKQGRGDTPQEPSKQKEPTVKKLQQAERNNRVQNGSMGCC